MVASVTVSTVSYTVALPTCNCHIPVDLLIYIIVIVK